MCAAPHTETSTHVDGLDSYIRLSCAFVTIIVQSIIIGNNMKLHRVLLECKSPQGTIVELEVINKLFPAEREWRQHNSEASPKTEDGKRSRDFSLQNCVTFSLRSSYYWCFDRGHGACG